MRRHDETVTLDIRVPDRQGLEEMDSSGYLEIEHLFVTPNADLANIGHATQANTATVRESER